MHAPSRGCFDVLPRKLRCLDSGHIRPDDLGPDEFNSRGTATMCMCFLTEVIIFENLRR